VMNADGSDQVNLSNSAGSDRRPSWSPDGSKIAFTSSRDGNFETYVMNADGTDQVNLSNNPAFDVDPMWSPDGTRIVFESNRDATSTVFYLAEIYVMNADGTGVIRLTDDPGSDWSPAWSPDGSKIAFTSSRDGVSNEIYVMNADGSDVTRLTDDPNIDQDPRWQTIPVPDADGDGIPDAEDRCPATALPDVPSGGLKGARFAAQRDGTFDSGQPKYDGLYTLGDTAGCSGAQIIALERLGEGHVKHGISKGALEEFIASL
jgi:hypothetical protein